MTVGSDTSRDIGFIEIDVDGNKDYSTRNLNFKLMDEVNVGG